MNGDMGSVSIPAVMIGNADGQMLVDRLAADAADDDVETDDEIVTVRLARGIFASVPGRPNVVADFSSRGPSLSDANFVKPDVTAPGVDILAGHTPDVANGLRGENYQYMSGTSQSAPEVTGVAALLKEAHPTWSPSAIKSALMTTTYVEVERTDGVAADAFDMGAGHIDPNRAVDPGLVYESSFADYAAYLCGLPEPPFARADCAAHAAAGRTSSAVDLNLPSIGVADLISGDVVRRSVTNIGPPASFTAELIEPPDLDIVVEPPTLVLGTGQTAEFSIRFVDQGAERDVWSFGELAWASSAHRVESPLAVKAVTVRTPPEMFLTGRQGTVAVPVAFGYSGAYGALVHGLRLPTLDENGQVPRGFVDDDPTNNFTFREGNGVTMHALTVPPNQLLLRVALFDEETDGQDDLDLFLFYCPNNQCSQLAKSDGVTSDEEIDIPLPQAGSYALLVHGFETDQVAGGPGANYSLFTWSIGLNDAVGNLTVNGARCRRQRPARRPSAPVGGARFRLALSRRDLAHHAERPLRRDRDQRRDALAAPSAAFAVAEAADEVIIDEARGLHVRVDDRRADELEPSALEIQRKRVGFLARRRHVALLTPAIHDRLAADEIPDVAVEGAELLLNGEEAARVSDCRLDLLAIADDACVLHQPFDGARREARHFAGIEARERAPIAVALPQDRPPAQPRLRCFEDEKLEVHAVVAHGHAPLLVVVARVRRVDALAPSAPHDALLRRHSKVSATGWHGTGNRAEFENT